MNRILIAVGLSDFDDSLVTTAAKLCKALQGRIRVLHIENSAPYGYAPSDPQEPAVDISVTAEPSMNETLELIRNRLVAEGIECDFRKLKGPVAENIILAAREFRAGLIVISGHQHAHFYQCFFGTRTESIIRKAPCPVVVVPPD